MSIDIESVLNAELPSWTMSWSPDDVILYHLAIGAGDPPCELRTLNYAFEGQLSVLPTFSSAAAQRDHRVLLDLPGMDVDRDRVLHGEQTVEVFAALPSAGEATLTSRVTEIVDKGKAAIVYLETDARTADGTLLTVNRSSLFFPGEGGFSGGAPAASASREPEAPEREPDVTVLRSTLPQQALLYRLTGDKALLHVDPAVAGRMGFERPILHGLCTFGLTCMTAVDQLLAGDVQRIASFGGRFAAPVFPGETLEIAIWKDEPDVRLRVRSRDRGIDVLKHGHLRVA
ncbi:MAG TPA: MaoC/PaaZ C-terminal domain-containing protein [Streptosporangiaceae bacterium]|jgi:acyl dehydratase|nr:MaoC/PaaZ C-terminal domain-containing protein [Streptosporangiaceae bacterium]